MRQVLCPVLVEREDELRALLEALDGAVAGVGGADTTCTTPSTHGETKDAGYGSGLSFRDPDGIALEFFAPPS